MSQVRAPLVGLDDAFFWDGVEARELRLERCADCRRLRQPPGPMCPACGSLATEVFAPEPHGRLLSWILQRHPPAAVSEQEVIALVELDCGARLVTNLRDADHTALHLDAPVGISFDVLDGVTLPQARLTTQGEDRS